MNHFHGLISNAISQMKWFWSALLLICCVNWSGVVQAGLSLNIESVTFGSPITVGDSATLSVNVFASGDDLYSLKSLSSNGPFSLTNSNCPDGSKMMLRSGCWLNITFTPTAAGSYSENLSVSFYSYVTQSDNNPMTVTLGLKAAGDGVFYGIRADDDGDGVENDGDLCPNTPAGEQVDSLGCSEAQKDSDGDSVSDLFDFCPNTPAGESVDTEGCSNSQKDADGDGVSDAVDQCPNTPAGESVDSEGCSDAQKDADGDGVSDTVDQCPNTPAGESVDSEGCSNSQKDADGDGVSDAVDQCSNTPAGESVDSEGCSDSQKDGDGDGVSDAVDQCPDQAGDGADGCPSASQVSDVLDGYASGDSQLERTSTVIADSCTSDRTTGRLKEDCDALIAGAYAGLAGIGDALREITPERAIKANDSNHQLGKVQNQNVGGRIAALRSGARGISAQGLAANVGDQRVAFNQASDFMSNFSMRAGGASADEEVGMLENSRWGVFVTGEFTSGDRDKTERESGFDFDTTGITAGADYRIQDGFILGAALTYSDNETKLDGDQGVLDTKGRSLSVYGTYFKSDSYFIDFAVSMGRSDFDQSRKLEYKLGNDPWVRQIFYADYDGDTLGAFIGGGWDFNRGPLSLGLRADLEYLRSESDGFNEIASDANGTGAGWAVKMDSSDQDWLTGGITGRASYVFNQSWGVLIPYAEIDYSHEFRGDAQIITGSFAADASGMSLQVLIDEPDRDFFKLRVGTSIQMPHGLSAFLDYGRLMSSSYWHSHTISAGLRYEF